MFPDGDLRVTEIIDASFTRQSNKVDLSANLAKLGNV